MPRSSLVGGSYRLQRASTPRRSLAGGSFMPLPRLRRRAPCSCVGRRCELAPSPPADKLTRTVATTDPISSFAAIPPPLPRLLQAKEEGPVIEEYSFSFGYPSDNTIELEMIMSCSGYKGGTTFSTNASEVTPDQMRYFLTLDNGSRKISRGFEKMEYHAASILKARYDQNWDRVYADQNEQLKYIPGMFPFNAQAFFDANGCLYHPEDYNFEKEEYPGISPIYNSVTISLDGPKDLIAYRVKMAAGHMRLYHGFYGDVLDGRMVLRFRQQARAF
nr:unnamed protein product [Digitaria exilis]